MICIKSLGGPTVPVNAPLTVYTDALSAKQSIERPHISRTARFRLGGRPFVPTIRHLISLRSKHGAPTNFVHVRSHTEAKDFASRGNAFADIIADRAAADPHNGPD